MALRRVTQILHKLGTGVTLARNRASRSAPVFELRRTAASAAAVAAPPSPMSAAPKALSEGMVETPITISNEEIHETKRQLLALGCTTCQVQAYIESGLKDYTMFSPAALDTTGHLQQLPMAIKILDGSVLSELPTEEWPTLVAAAEKVLRVSARDLNKDGQLGFLEYVVWSAMEGRSRRGDLLASLYMCFLMIDVDGNGYITFEELVCWYKIAMNLGRLGGQFQPNSTPEELAQTYMGRYDQNHDHKISLMEFIQAGLLAKSEHPALVKI